MAEDDEVVRVYHANMVKMLCRPFAIRFRQQVVPLADEHIVGVVSQAAFG